MPIFRRRPRVICIGSASKDLFFPTDEGEILETPEDLTAQRKVAFELGGKYRVDDRYESVGGVAANVAWGLSRLNIAAAPYSRIGGDEVGRWILSEFRRAGVRTDLLEVDRSVGTDVSAIIVLTQNGERTIFHNRDANEGLVIEPKRLRGAEWIFVSALNGDWEDKLRVAARSATENRSKLALNPGQHNLRGNPALVLETVSKADMLLLNKDEALELVMKSGKDVSADELNDERFLLSALLSAGAKTIGMTDGDRGAWAADATGFWHCPIGRVERVVDTTGAGDSFASAFFAAIAFHGLAVSDALRWGIAESGSVVGSYGATAGLLDTEEIRRRAEELRSERL
ncbi:MAG: carbohydrate kinase family protein [Candidatus Moranbacteria bacterium]|nr:carbohydrate kinase family protein [Candidatus Moranbacteria bacterium]